jgi:hypothetical protein
MVNLMEQMKEIHLEPMMERNLVLDSVDSMVMKMELKTAQS